MMPYSKSLLWFLLAAPHGNIVTDQEYAVYSAALSNLRSSQADKNSAVVIINETLEDQRTADIGGGCWNSAPEPRRGEDAWKANRSRTLAGSRKLFGKKLTITRPYNLVSSEEGDKWQQERSQPKIALDPPSKEDPDPFPESSDLIRVSNVFFNVNKTVALVYVSVKCGSICGLSEWIVAEKNQGIWKASSGPACGEVN